MMQSIYSAVSAMKAQQTRLDTIAVNLANVNQNGYKAKRVDFKDALYTAMSSPVAADNGGNLLKGTGAVVGATATNFGAGARVATGKPLDVAIAGKGFFTVQGSDGGTYYTRGGNFDVSVEGDLRYLVTASGNYVLDAAGQRIALPPNTVPAISPDGVITAGGRQIAVLGLVQFQNEAGLLAQGNGLFAQSPASGAPRAAVSELVQGSVEGSNVELSQELTLLIRTQRAYSLASKALQTADDMDSLANHLR
ncbi:MAG: flagellar hook-basal body protein [Clostridia bacterium]|nr:flagellar hook-basal body protein [Clostridia bacterium]